MSRVIHVFRQPERFVAGTVGEPGDRSFYLQAIEEARTVSVLLEKQQVSVLADRISALLQEVARRFGSELPDDRSPAPTSIPWPCRSRRSSGSARWAWAGTPTRARSSSSCSPSPRRRSTSRSSSTTPRKGPDALRVFLSPLQAKAFADRAERVVSAGRPPCPLCAEPLDPEGHVCVRLNGYHQRSPVAD